ncbi:MAG: hypothetical protein NWF04_05945 [Candidatus Bathyarchaeota archaeon]|nr:hypothetical protein [Candidatus Bathyarchaeota archaeon]
MKASVPFCLDTTLCCGQVFRWDRHGGWWYGVAQDCVFKVQQNGSELKYDNADYEFVEHYFSLDHDLDAISKSINKDHHIERALKAYWGLRLIRQDPWECLMSYICATYKSIAAIKGMLNALGQKFGEKLSLDGYKYYAFPKPEKLANAAVTELQECGLGYRAKYLQATAKQIHEGNINLEELKRMPYSQAKKALCTLPGVGVKVADCVLLFSLGKLEAFPVDVWVKRVMLKRYQNKFPTQLIQKLSKAESLCNSDYEKLNNFGRTYFGQYAGYAQEYLYHYERIA